MISPFSLVIFGATGDLTQKKLVPALFTLYREKLFPKDFLIIGLSRRAIVKKEFFTLIQSTVARRKKYNEQEWKDFTTHIVYVQGNFEDQEAYQIIRSSLNLPNTMLYLATPPKYYEVILNNISKSGLARKNESGWTRILIEKPFGKDLETAQMLDSKLDTLFKEDQIYRIDHYLGKETVQNIIAFRFANGIFDPVWNANYLDHVQITLSEKEGIGPRGAFYDGVGQLRDMTQSHLMQLIAMVAMESPRSFSADGVWKARAAAISAIRCIQPYEVSKNVLRGQYKGYQLEKNVAHYSETETFVALKLYVDTPRFKNVPFYVRAGKAMKEDVVEISLVFKQVCHILFKEVGCPEEGNILTMRIQPDEGINLRFIAKEPGHEMKLSAINMAFTYASEFKSKEVVDAYERVLQDAFLGDQMLFNKSDELVSSWRFITEILKGWKAGKSGLISYTKGSWGPGEANELIERDGRKWILS